MTSADLIAIVKKQPIGFACGVICVVCAGMIYFSSSQIEDKQADYDAKSAEAAKILGNVGNFTKLPEQTTEIQALAKEIDSRLIRAGQLAVNQQYFYKLEAETEVKMTDLRQSPAAKNAKAQSLYVAIPFNVTVQGTFKQLLAFLQKLETGPRFCRFTGVGFTKIGTTSESTRSAAGSEASGMTMTLKLELLGMP